VTNPRICYVLTSPFAVNGFMLTHLRVLSDYFSITLVVNTKEYPLSSAIDSRVRVKHCDIKRKISPWNDIKALFWLLIFFSREHFDLVHSITPKAGMLAMSAAWVTCVPARIHTFTGQVWSTKEGIARSFLRLIDQFISCLATRIHVDSQSQLHFLEQERVISGSKSAVIGPGSISGVDIERFKPCSEMRSMLRQQLGIAEDSIVFISLGRITRDKGVIELATAFSRLTHSNTNVVLMIAGPDEGGLMPELQSLLKDVMSQVVLLPRVVKAENFLASADVLVLPSYREGFGTVVLEAAAVGLPTIGTRIYGLTDAIIENKTGILTPVRDVDALYSAMKLLVDSEDKCHAMGQAAKQRTNELFSAEAISNAWYEEYRLQLNKYSFSMTKKRLIDLLFSFAALIALFVPILLVSLLVKLTSPGPALYWSDRVGRANSIFKMPKFRTMRIDTPTVATHLLDQPEHWLTPVGSFLRRTSLDEIPQLWSILKGDMSFVGPRPALFNQDDLIALRTQSGVDALLPGLTGWAQINGRDELSIEEKVNFDVEYLHHHSVWFDLKILWLTALKVASSQGVSH
jgi:lipopolysaccharide/colanic/teichoic acid biosynthesis glycosyltransferase